MALDMVTTLCQGEDPVADLVLAFDVSLDRMLSEALEHPQIVVVKFDVDRLCFAELIALFDIVAIHASSPCTANSASSNGVYANLIDTFGDEDGTRRIFERLRSSDKLVEIVFDIAALAAASLIAPARRCRRCGIKGTGCARSVATNFRRCCGAWPHPCRTV